MLPGIVPEVMAADTAAMRTDLALVEAMLRETLGRQVGALSPWAMRRIDAALKLVLGLS